DRANRLAPDLDRRAKTRGDSLTRAASLALREVAGTNVSVRSGARCRQRRRPPAFLPARPAPLFREPRKQEGRLPGRQHGTPGGRELLGRLPRTERARRLETGNCR